MADFLSGYNSQNQINQQRTLGDLQNYGALATIVGELRKQQQAQALQEAVASGDTSKLLTIPGGIDIVKKIQDIKNGATTNALNTTKIDQINKQTAAAANQQGALSRLQAKLDPATYNTDYPELTHPVDTVSLNDQDAIAQMQAAGSKPFSTVVNNPAAMQALAVQADPKSAVPALLKAGAGSQEKPYNLPPGGTRYGPDNKPIVTAPDSTGAKIAVQNLRYNTGLNPDGSSPAPPAAQPAAAPQPGGPVATDAVVAPPIPPMPAAVAALPPKDQADWIKKQAGESGPGSRESVYINRVTTAGREAQKDLENVVRVKLTASRGMFGGRGQGPGIMDAGQETLANTLTGQEVQSYNVFAAGLQRSLSTIETAGLSPPGSLTHQMEVLTFKDGDTNLTKLQKLAQIRQIVQAGLETVQANPRVPAATKEDIDKIIVGVQKAVPFTQGDLLDLQEKQLTNPKMTLKDVIAQTQKAPTSPAPTGINQKTWDFMTPEQKKLWQN